MVTSNKLPDKKVVKMAENNANAVVPQRTLLGEVNEHITCPLCRGYYIDATTIVECLHSFCRSCIIKHLQAKSYCPVCEMMINSAKPNIKVDKALQDIVYKLVPGLFQREMERRQQFYASRPGPAASTTPEQRGEDTERIIFSPEDVISFSLEYADATDTDSISSKSSDSNEAQPASATTRRYLQCPAVVNISHLKKFLSMKFDIDSTQFAIDILYKRVPLPDYYTLMDIAYIYNWKRNEPMRFFYQIIDYIAIRNRLFDINRKGSHFQDKSSPASTEDTNVSSPAPNLNDQGSEASSGTNSPMPEENNSKATNDTLKKEDKTTAQNREAPDKLKLAENSQLSKKDDEVEKSQFLNSFELTAKSNTVQTKSPIKSTAVESKPNDVKSPITTKSEEKPTDTLKRKHQAPTNTPELKKLRIELEKAKLPSPVNSLSSGTSVSNNQSNKPVESQEPKTMEGTPKPQPTFAIPPTLPSVPAKEIKHQQHAVKQQTTENSGIKRTVAAPPSNTTPKRKPPTDTQSPMQQFMGQKLVSPIKLQIPKVEAQSPITKSSDVQKPAVKKMPDLKPGIPQTSQNKNQPKVRMDLLANNSDPTIDRSKILSQQKSSLSVQNAPQTSGDPLKTLFDSCKINIPSSLSITLTDQKLETRNTTDTINADAKKSVVNKNLASASNTVSHKVPSPPVHNYIEILKLPDTDPKKQNKLEGNPDVKTNIQNKNDTPTTGQTKSNKTSESSAKGPIPNLKPISDTKLGKQSNNFAAPITFQQTFEQQLQTMQVDKKAKPIRNKSQVPKLVPATPKSFNNLPKSNSSVSKPLPSGEIKSTSSALDLSTPHNMQTHSGQQQTYKALETMQSISNLSKKHNLASKGPSLSMSQSSTTNMTNRPLTGVNPLRIPSTSNMNQMKLEKGGPHGNNSRQDGHNKSILSKPSNNASPTISSSAYQASPMASPSTTQPSPRQTRSPSSSPKLVIAEEKQSINSLEQNLNQSNQITSTQIPNPNSPKNEFVKSSPGPSKLAKSGKSLTPSVGNLAQQPLMPSMKSSTATLSSPNHYLRPPMIATHHAFIRQQMQMDVWLNAKRQYDFMKNMVAHQNQNDFNNKDKQ